MNKDLFEKALKDNYPNSAADFDLDAAWEALEARRKKPKHHAIFWFFAGALLLLGGLVGWWLQTDGHKSVLAHSAGEPVHSHEMVPVTTEHHNVTPLAVVPLRSIDNTAVAKGSNNSNPVSPVHSPNGTSISVKTSQNIPQNKTEYRVSVLKNEKTGIEQRLANTAILTSIVSANDALTNQPAMASETAITFKNTADRNRFTLLETLPQVVPLVSPPKTSALALSPWSVDFIEQKKRKPKTPNWWLGAQATYGFNLLKRQGTSTYVDARAMDELPLDLIQIGLNIRRGLKRNWFVETGIQYAQWTDVRRYTAQEEHTETVPNLLLLQVVQVNGDVEDFYGPGSVIVRQQVTSENYNRYQYFELPLMAGKAFPLGTHWRLDLSAGGIIGLGSRSSGTVTIGSDDLPVRDLPYRKAGSLSAEARMSMMYKTKIGSIGLSVSGRSGINSQTKSGAMFEEKRRSLGLGFLLQHAF